MLFWEGNQIKNEMKEKISNIEKLSFEEALKELESIVSKMENGEISLDDNIANYEYGVGLKKYFGENFD